MSPGIHMCVYARARDVHIITYMTEYDTVTHLIPLEFPLHLQSSPWNQPWLVLS